MKILVTSDWHLDHVTAGVHRIGEIEDFFDSLPLDDDFDAFFHLGDVCDPGNRLDFYHAEVIKGFVDEIGEHIPEQYWVTGNHDVIEMKGYHSTLAFLEDRERSIYSFVRPRFHVSDHFSRLGILALPYTAKSNDPDEVESFIDKAFEEAKRHDGPVIVIGHMTVPGADLGSETKELARGRDIELPEKRLASLRPDLILNGHYHQRQVVKTAHYEVHIPGSPIRFTFGESDASEKGYMVIEL